LKLMNALLVTALVLFTAGVVHADDISGGDSRIVIGTGPGGSPDCSEFQGSAVDGIISDDCIVTGTDATSVTFAVPTADVLGGALSCSSSLTNIGWTTPGSFTATIDGTSVDACTFTAPTTVSLWTWAYLAISGDGIPLWYVGSSSAFNDGDCDLDDDTLGIPVGCDITFSNSGATGTQLFTADAVFDGSPDGVGGLAPFPEPSTLALMLLGLAPCAFLRRRVAQR